MRDEIVLSSERTSKNTDKLDRNTNKMDTEIFEVTLHGGSPWGFRLQGGKEFRAPLLIAKVTAGSKAAKQGVIVGDWLLSINHEPCDDMTHSNALNFIKKSGNVLDLTLERRPYEDNGLYSTNSLPRGTRLTNGTNNNNHAYKSVEGYATLPRKKAVNNDNEKDFVDQYNHDQDFHRDSEEYIRNSSLTTHSSGISTKHIEEDNDMLLGRDNVMSPTSDDWSPDLISDSFRAPKPIRLISKDDQEVLQSSRTDTSRVKSPTSLHGFTDKPAPIGRGARRTNDEEMKDSTDNPMLNSGAGLDEEQQNADNDSAAEQPYRRYSYHGSAIRDPEDRPPDGTERPRIQAGSGWYKELFKEMHTGAGTSSGLSSLLASDASPPKNDARGLFKGYVRRSKSTVQESAIRPTRNETTHAEPSSPTRRTDSQRNQDDRRNRYSLGALPSSTEPAVKMREKPTTRNKIPSWYRELQKGNDVSEEEIIEDRRHSKGYQVPGSPRTPGAVGPEYPVVRSYSLGTRPASAPVIHRDPPQRKHTHNNNNRRQNERTPSPAMRYAAATRQSPKVEPERKASASNLYEDHLRNRQNTPNEKRKVDTYKPVDYVKQFEEEEERYREDERRAKEDLERKLREGDKLKEEAERKRLEVERKKQEELESRKKPKPARALYNFSPQSIKEINLRKGERVSFFRTIDPNWSEGESQGKIGLFPTTYIEFLQVEEEEDEVAETGGKGRAKYNFKAETPRELNLQKGEIVTITRQIDDNWYEGMNENGTGIFPVAYVEVITEPSVRSPQGSPKKVQEQVIKQNGLPEVHSSPGPYQPPSPPQEDNHMFNSDANEDISGLDGERFVVVFGYSPQNEDELLLAEGDFVKVVEKCDDGWFVGISEKSGGFGTFPGNYVQPVAS